MCVRDTHIYTVTSLITERVLEKMARNFSDKQRAYLKGGSSVTNLSIFSDFVMLILDENIQVGAIYLDIA